MIIKNEELKNGDLPINKIVLGDCLSVMKKFPANSIDSLITDPPYALEFMGKGWDKVLPSVEIWKEALRIAKPGATLLAFGGTRTYHRLTCAIEDAGWEIRDCIMYLYGSGFPKSLNIGKAIDNRQVGNDVIRPWLESLGSREELATAAQVTPRQIDHYLGNNKTPCPQTLTFDRFKLLCNAFNTVPEWAEKMYPQKGEEIGIIRHSRSGGNDFAKRPGSTSVPRKEVQFAPATDAARQWEGWGTALKPAYEPIVIAMKPNDGTYANNALKWGVAGLNIDGCRVELKEGDEKTKGGMTGNKSGRVGYMIKDENSTFVSKVDNAKGRFPANIIHDGSDEVIKLFPNSKGQQGDVRGSENSHTGDENTNCYGEYGRTKFTKRNDSGSAARFFYCAKASKSERNAGCDTLEAKAMCDIDKMGGLKCSMKTGSGNDRNVLKKNNHPTIKPLALIKYLCKLTETPTKGIVIDMFGGSGTTGVACEKLGRKYILIEKELEYCEISAKRIESERKQLKMF